MKHSVCKTFIFYALKIRLFPFYVSNINKFEYLKKYDSKYLLFDWQVFAI